MNKLLIVLQVIMWINCRSGKYTSMLVLCVPCHRAARIRGGNASMLMRKLSYILLLVKVTVTVRVCNELTIFLIEFKLLVLSAAVYPEAVTYAAPGSDNGRGVAPISE